MKNKFLQVFNEVSDQVKNEVKKAPSNGFKFYYALDNAIKFWCQQLKFSQYNYILNGIKSYKIEDLIDDLWEEWKHKPLINLNPFGRSEEGSKLFNFTKAIFERINIENNQYTFVVILGFVITAVGYCTYLLESPEQPEKIINSRIDYKPSKPSDDISPNISQVSTPLASVVQPIVKNLLILVVFATQKSIVDSIQAKGEIDYNDCEQLYKATQYLRQDTEDNLLSQWSAINKFNAIEKSEYDIYLILIELNQVDEGFQKDVNQLERYDAFRKLSDLAVNVQVSPRLQMEAYGIFDVYNR